MSSFLIVLTQAIDSSSSANISNVAIINSLVEMGHEADVICPCCHKKSGIFIRSEINIIRYGGYCDGNTNQVTTNRKKNVIRTAIKRLYYLFHAFDRSQRIARRISVRSLNSKNYDYMISMSDPKTAHIAAKTLKRQGLKYKKWMQYWGDPLTIDITRLSKLPKCVLIKKEKRLLDLADVIVYVSPFTCTKQKELFKSNAHKMFFLPPPFFKEDDNHERLKNSKPISVGYFGAYESFVRNIVPLYNIFKEKKFPNAELFLVGNTDLTLEGQDNIQIFSRVPYSEIERMQSECSVLFCMTNKIGTQIPAKIYYSASTYKPIIIAVDGELSKEMIQYFNSYNRFIVCKNTESDIEASINQAMLMVGNCSPCKELAPMVITRKLLDIIER